MSRSYDIKTIEFHESAITASAARNVARLDLDASDSAVSSWSDSALINFHRIAIEALRLGKENGIDGPAGVFDVLVTADGRRVNATLQRVNKGRFGLKTVWRLAHDEAAVFGRQFIPNGAKSRIQKALGLHEEKVVAPAKRAVKCRCAFVGSPVFFTLEIE